jgi:hypothetical protein
MAIKDYVEAQGAAMQAGKLREGARTISALMPEDVVQGMVKEAERLEEDVRSWCAAQECPKEAEALAHRRFWELDTRGKLVTGSAVQA